VKILSKIIATSLVLFTACGGGSSGATSEKASEKIRFLNAVKQVSSINIQLGSNIFIEELPYGESTNFVEATEGEAIPLSVTSFEQVLPILTGDQSVESGSKTTYIFFDESRVVGLTEVTEDAVSPLPNESSLRFFNLSEKQNSVDVYLLLRGAELEDQAPAITALGFNSNSMYFSFPSGVYDIVYTASGTTTIVRKAEAVTFTKGKVYSHVLLDQIGPLIGQTSRIFEDSVF